MGSDSAGSTLSKVTLDLLPEDVENAFQKEHIQSSIIPLRFALFSGLVIYSLFFINDMVLYNSVSSYFLTLRFAIGFPAILVAFIASYIPEYWRHAEGVNLSGATIVGLSLVGMAFFGADHPEISRISGGLTPVFLYMHVFLKLRFKHVFIAGTGIFLMQALVELLVYDVPLPIRIASLSYVGAVNFIGIFMAYQLEKRSKLEFLLTRDLKKAVDEIKTLRGIVPICSLCKKIRDDKGYWNQIETYIQAHSDAEFSHGMCPECTDKTYGHTAWYKKMKNKGNA